MSYLCLRASKDFEPSHYGIQTIKMGFNHFRMHVTFQYRGLHHLDMYCTLIIEAWLKLNIHFDCRYLEVWNACIISLVFLVLNVRDGIESKYPSIVFLSIVWQKCSLMTYKIAKMILIWPNNVIRKTAYWGLGYQKIWPWPLTYFWLFHLEIIQYSYTVNCIYFGCIVFHKHISLLVLVKQIF